MDRKETTKFLGNLLMSKLGGIGKYYAKEVSLDYGTKDVRRIDFLEFQPSGQMSISDIEKGIFVCYEVKSCKEDVYNGNGLNFIGEKNYIVTTMECYKDILPDINSGKLRKHIKSCNPENTDNFGIMVAVPKFIDVYDEFESPTKLSSDDNFRDWELKAIKPCYKARRKRSLTELLFLMVRSGR